MQAILLFSIACAVNGHAFMQWSTRREVSAAFGKQRRHLLQRKTRRMRRRRSRRTRRVRAMSSSMYSVMDGRQTNMTSELTHATAMQVSSRFALEWKKDQLSMKWVN